MDRPASATAILALTGIAVTTNTRGEAVLRFADPIEAVDLLIRSAGHVVRERPWLQAADRWRSLERELQ